MLALLPVGLMAADQVLLEQLKQVDYAKETGSLKHAILATMKQDQMQNGWEAALLNIAVDPTAELDGRQLAGELLKLCITPASAGRLLPLLQENDMATIARDLLAGLEDASVDIALIDALNHTQGRFRVGILSTLAKRRSSAAVAPIVALTRSSPDMDSITASLLALGRIGGKDAGTFFLENLSWLQQPAPISTAFAEGALLLLEAPEGNQSSSPKSLQRIAEGILEKAPTLGAKTAAMVWLQQTDPGNAKRIMALMGSNDPSNASLAAAAQPYLQLSGKSESLLLKEGPGWSEHAQMLMLNGLLDAQQPVAIQLARKLFDTSEATAQENALLTTCIAVMQVQGELSDAKALLPLVPGKSEVAESAKVALGHLPDPTVNDWILETLPTADEETQQALLEILVSRSMRSALKGLLATVDQYPSRTQKSIYRAIGDLGDLEIVHQLMAQRPQTPPALKSEIERTIVDIGRRFPTPVVSVELINQWKAASGDDKDRLLRMIGAIDQSPSIKLIAQLVLQPEPDPIALRALLAAQSASVLEPLQAFLARQDIRDADRKGAWNTLFRITKDAFENWADNRGDLWLLCHDSAPGIDELKTMIAFTVDIQREAFIPWLENLSEPEVESERVDALTFLKKSAGL